MEDLIKEYRKALKDIRRQKVEVQTKINIYKKLYGRDPEDEEVKKELKELKKEKKVYIGAESDLILAIQWMKSGHMPGLRRGIERRGVYQNTKLVDPLLMQRYYRSNENPYEWDMESKEHVVTLTEQINIDDILSILTDTEREILLMKKGYALTLSKIADERGITKAAVSKTVKKAELKIAKHVESLKEMGQWNSYSL